MARTRGHKAPDLPLASEVPEVPSEAAAAEWYDTHDTSQLETESVDGRSSTGRGLETVAIRVSRHEILELKRRAKDLGVGHTTYIRLLINRHVLREPPIH